MRLAGTSGGSETGLVDTAKGGQKVVVKAPPRNARRRRNRSRHLRLLRLVPCRQRITLAPVVLSKRIWEVPSPSIGSFNFIKTLDIERSARESNTLRYLSPTPLLSFLLLPYLMCKSRSPAPRSLFLFAPLPKLHPRVLLLPLLLPCIPCKSTVVSEHAPWLSLPHSATFLSLSLCTFLNRLVQTCLITLLLILHLRNR